MDLRSVQRPLKKKYRDEPGSSRITLEAKASQEDTPISCSVDVGKAVYEAGAHEGVGGTGEVACSGDLLLGALAACAQVTCQMVAGSMGIVAEKIEVTVEGDMDLAGTLGVSREAPVGFESIRTKIEIVAPGATEDQMEKLRKSTEQYCVVYQTLAKTPELKTEWT
ncbi:MAG TPA: OsmC family protein [Rubrobacter sp.]|nr:OsmC family protein [Rubrobacter sp.]